MSEPQGVNSAMLTSMENAQGNNGSGAAMPSNQPGNRAIGQKFGGEGVGNQFAQSSNLDNNLAGVGGVNPIQTRPAFESDPFSDAFGGMIAPTPDAMGEINDMNFHGNVGAANFSLGEQTNLPKEGMTFAGAGNALGG